LDFEDEEYNGAKANLCVDIFSKALSAAWGTSSPTSTRITQAATAVREVLLAATQSSRKVCLACLPLAHSLRKVCLVCLPSVPPQLHPSRKVCLECLPSVLSTVRPFFEYGEPGQ
jgi:hypothetical protein